MIPGCETSGKSWTEVHFSHILRTFWESFASVSGGDGSCSGWWVMGQSCTTCSTFASPIPHFLQMVSTARPILCSQYTRSGWWPLLRRPIVICSFHDNFDSSLRPSVSPFMPYTRRILSWIFSPLVARLVVAFAELL